MEISNEVWLLIAGGFLTSILGAFWWYYRKRLTRLEALESAVFGISGVHVQLHKYVTHDTLERRLNDLTTHIKGIAEEGVAREERIIDAIRNSSTDISADMRDIKQDIRATNLRIDTIINAGR